jgi:multiple sugar transport system ATP-binding protein
MASVTYDHVWKRFGDVVAVQDLNLAIEDQDFLVLVGPSGCGRRQPCAVSLFGRNLRG